MPSTPVLDAQRDAADALAAGTRLAEFEVRGVLGLGGFGIVYRAWDHALEREVALKEYMPAALAVRGKGAKVTLRSRAHAETFAIGLRSFVNEARLLARFDHPSLVKVYRFWEEHDTAYMVMPYYRGRTLRQVRQATEQPPDEAACRRIVDPLLSALELLHREGVYHRDIAPDNIVIGIDGEPVLLDFGAARRVITGRTQTLTAILKPNFAPLEQYADMPSMRQGPWTDLYGLGATVYYLVTGRAPLPAAARALHDEMPTLAAQPPAAGFSAAFLGAIDWTLALRPADRPQSVQMLRDVLDGRMALPQRARRDITLPGITVRSAAGDGWTSDAMAKTVSQPPPLPDAPGSNSADRAPRRRALRGVAAALVVVALGAAAWMSAATKDEQPAAAASMPVPALAEPQPAEPVTVPAPVPAPAAATRAAPQPTPAAPAAPPVAGDGARHAEPKAAARRDAEPAAVLGPRERCGERVLLALLWCMKRECEQPELQAHPECRRLHELEQANRAREP